jgi:3-hydroxy-D-aspartate aldolase
MTQPVPARVGDTIDEVDTPALILDLDAFEANVALMASEAARMGVALRPHAKSNKCAEIARRQIAAGAVGVCVQKVSEAVALAEAGIDDILICNELVGQHKIAALVELSGRIRVAACVDDIGNVAAIERAAAAAGTKVSLLVDVDVGQGRCGVSPSQVVQLAQAIVSAPHLKFAGLQAYHGGAQHIRDVGERRAAALSAVSQAAAARDALAAAGIACPLITGAGTGTFRYEGASGLYTEIQPGSYVFMDADYNRNRWEAFDAGHQAPRPLSPPPGEGPPSRPSPPFGQSLHVLATVMSRVEASRPIVDAGLKALAVDSGMPLVDGRPGVTYERASDEHGNLRVELEGAGRPVAGLSLGDRVRLIPGHCDPTVNLYDWLVAIRGGRVEAVWPVTARGCLS